MTPLLGPDAFPGEWISAERAGASWVGEAWFDGIVLFTTWPREAAGALLPPEWCLATARTDADEHPVVFLLGRQHDTSVLFGGMRVPTDADYDEAMIMVPFVRPRSGRSLHTFIPLMYSGDARATWSGNTHYGFAKRPGAIERFGRSFAVTDGDGSLAMHMTVHDGGAWRVPEAEPLSAEVAAFRSLGRLPIVGRRDDREDIVSYFGWDLTASAVRSIGATLTLDAAFPGPLGSGGGLPGPDRGIEIEVLRWRLSWPTPFRARGP